MTFYNQDGTSISLNIYMNDLLVKLCPFWFPKTTYLGHFRSYQDIQMLIRVLYNYLRIQRVGDATYFGFKKEADSFLEWIEGEFIGFLSDSMIIYGEDEYEEYVKLLNA